MLADDRRPPTTCDHPEALRQYVWLKIVDGRLVEADYDCPACDAEIRQRTKGAAA